MKDPKIILSSFKAILKTKIAGLDTAFKAIKERDRSAQMPGTVAVIRELRDLDRLLTDLESEKVKG